MARRKTAAERREEERASERARWAADGYLFAVTWSIDGLAFGPQYLRSLDEALKKRDELIAQNEQPIPPDFYDRQAHLVKMTVRVEGHRDGAWRQIAGSERQCVSGVRYAD